MKRESLVKTIFVSSTFRDMQAERDLLRYDVTSRLNAFAEPYGRRVELLDLRWGIDSTDLDSEAAQRKVLDVCLGEIERARPLFIGLIGGRYGWVPEPEDIAGRLHMSYSWFRRVFKQYTGFSPGRYILELKIEKLYDPVHDRNMVSILQTPNKRLAHARVPMYWDIDLGLWVFQEN